MCLQGQLRTWESANKAFDRLQNLDAKFFESATLFCIAEKNQMPT